MSSEFNIARVQFCPPCSTLFLWMIFLPNWMTAVSALWLALSTVLPLCMQMTSHLSLILMTTCRLFSTLYQGMQVPGATRLTLLSLRSCMVFGESSKSRSAGRQSRSFLVCSESIQDCYSYSHLGILRLVSASGSIRISSRCSERFLRPEFSRCKIWLPLYASQLCSMGQSFGPH